MWKKWKPYIFSIAISLAVGGLSALVTKGNMNIYDDIVSPPLAPPMILFPIVWTILFILMGVSAARIWEKRRLNMTKANRALTVYGVNLVVNFFWSVIFFNLRSFLFAFLWLLLLIAVIVVMICKFRALDKPATYLQIPYLIWCAFAAYLNFAIYILNR